MPSAPPASPTRPAPRTSRRARALAVALLGATALLAALGSPAHGAPASATSPGTARLWVTTADGTSRLLLHQTVAPGTGKVRGPGVTVLTDAPAQRVVGVGAALTHSAATLLLQLPAPERTRVLTELFDPAGPVRLAVVRIPLGSSDFVVGDHRTYDDQPAGVLDWGLAGLSTADDEDALRPVLREILAIAPDVRVVASPWSAPAWLKESGSLLGGRLRTDPQTLPTYADYLVRALVEHRAAGIPVHALTVQNEPQTRWHADYPRMEMPAAQQVALIGELVPRLQAAALPTRVLAFDHNWALHPADAAAVPPGQDPELDYVARVLRGTPASAVPGVAFHCYAGDASAQEDVHGAFPDREIWVTECSGSHAPGDSPGKVFADTLMWQSRHLLLASLRHWASAVLTWNLVLDPAGGPRNGGCATCTGVMTVDPVDGTVTANAEYYVLAHAGRFLPSGSARVLTSTSGTTPDHVAFRTPDGAAVVLLHNAGAQAQGVTVVVAGSTYPVRLPARSLATVTVGG